MKRKEFITMTATNHPITDAEPDDELVVIKLLNEMILDERWDLTNLGRSHLREAEAENAEILERLQDRDERRVNDILANR